MSYKPGHIFKSADDETLEAKEPGLWSSLTKAHKLLGMVAIVVSILFTYAYSRAQADARAVALALKVDTTSSEIIAQTQSREAAITASVETLGSTVKSIAAEVADMRVNGHLDHERRITKIEAIHAEETALIVHQLGVQQADHAAAMNKMQDALSRLSESQVRIATIVERLEKTNK